MLCERWAHRSGKARKETRKDGGCGSMDDRYIQRRKAATARRPRRRSAALLSQEVRARGAARKRVRRTGGGATEGVAAWVRVRARAARMRMRMPTPTDAQKKKTQPDAQDDEDPDPVCSPSPSSKIGSSPRARRRVGLGIPPGADVDTEAGGGGGGGEGGDPPREQPRRLRRRGGRTPFFKSGTACLARSLSTPLAPFSTGASASGRREARSTKRVVENQESGAQDEKERFEARSEDARGGVGGRAGCGGGWREARRAACQRGEKRWGRTCDEEQEQERVFEVVAAGEPVGDRRREREEHRVRCSYASLAASATMASSSPLNPCPSSSSSYTNACDVGGEGSCYVYISSGSVSSQLRVLELAVVNQRLADIEAPAEGRGREAGAGVAEEPTGRKELEASDDGVARGKLWNIIRTNTPGGDKQDDTLKFNSAFTPLRSGELISYAMRSIRILNPEYSEFPSNFLSHDGLGPTIWIVRKTLALSFNFFSRPPPNYAHFGHIGRVNGDFQTYTLELVTERRSHMKSTTDQLLPILPVTSIRLDSIYPFSNSSSPASADSGSEHPAKPFADESEVPFSVDNDNVIRIQPGGSEILIWSGPTGPSPRDRYTMQSQQ
ncbi:hypothetical protein FB451DRAFT_1192888 [Mycena latifolia]|nr:hypothetical protein FB451DRAFT_1192888 [Mycena latifolia]